MKAKFLTLDSRDFLKGLIMAVIASVITFLVNELQTGSSIDVVLLKRIGITAVIAFLSYILKNFFTNSKDEFVKAEPK